MSRPPITAHHLFLDLWLTPWTWMKPEIRRYRDGRIYAVCFGFGKLELIVD